MFFTDPDAVIFNGNDYSIFSVYSGDVQMDPGSSLGKPVENGIFQKRLKGKFADQEVFNAVFQSKFPGQIIVMA